MKMTQMSISVVKIEGVVDVWGIQVMNLSKSVSYAGFSF